VAYPQALIEMDIYMELPQGIQTAHGNSKDHMLKLEKNLYGQKQAGCVWNSFLVDKLMSIGFTPSLPN
jgi:asparagine synthetase A